MKKRTAIANLGVLLLGAGVLAQAPGWWASRGVVNPYRAARDYHPVNQGQLKHMVLRAYEEFHEKWPDAANAPILAQIDAFPAEGNHRPVNLGMLKHAAKPFYDRLIALGYATNYPWADGEPADFALANHGQLKNLFSFDLDAHDADANGIPDWWERLHFGSVTGAVASADNDGDGLSNLQEYHHGTDPQRQDTSGDGITDGWAVQYSLDPTARIGHLDANGDGLTNLENFLYGANPWSSDTSGDGLSDFLAVRIFHLDPAIAYLTGQRTSLSAVQGCSASIVAGQWATTPGGSLHAQSRNGAVAFMLAAPTAGTYGVVFNVEQYNALTSQSRFDLSLYVNGRYAGRQTVTAPYGAPAEALFATPHLEPGLHTFELHWHNLVENSYLAIHHAALLDLHGYDANESGTADWIEARADRAVHVPLLAASPVSPVTYQGTSPFRSEISVTSSASLPEDDPISVNMGPGHMWYAEMPLDPGGDDTLFTITEGITGQTITQGVEWVATNLLPQPDDLLLLRKDDALRLTAHPPEMPVGAVEITIVGVTNYVTTADAPVVHRFTETGEYSLQAAWGYDGQAASAVTTVKVVAASFTGDPVCLVGQSRLWSNPGLPSEAVLEHDLPWPLQEAPLDGGGRVLTLQVEDTVRRYIIARVGEDGPILASARINGVTSSVDRQFEVVGTMPDGTRIVEVTLALSSVPEDLRIRIEIFIDGASFEDGTRVAEFTAADFDEHGILRYRMLQTHVSNISTCHRVIVFDDGTGANLGEWH